MTVQEMHYELKLKLNKVDTQDYSNILVPEVDWYLNEAMTVFIKQRYGVTNIKREGFEETQKRIDDLKTLVVKEDPATPTATTIPTTVVSTTSDVGTYRADLSALAYDYMFLVRITCQSTKTSCQSGTKKLWGIQVQHDDLDTVLYDPFYKPSFEWEEVPLVFGENPDDPTSDRKGAIYLYSDGTFSVDSVFVEYLRHPLRISYADGVVDSTGVPIGYNYADGTPAAAVQNCELPQHTHKEVVDLAVAIVSGDLDHPMYQLKAIKMSINE